MQITFAEELGLSGPGVQSVSTFFANWASQCQPNITHSAILLGRENVKEQILAKLQEKSETGSLNVTVKADSVQEAVAFVASCIHIHEHLLEKTVVVRESAAWQFVDKNPGISIAISESPEIASTPTSRAGVIVIIPFASGDMGSQFPGIAGEFENSSIIIPRPDPYQFRQALEDIGCEKSDASRLATQCGRSWSVFRRQHATNPSIRNPDWLSHPSGFALSTLCLLGAWSDANEADRDLVEAVSGRKYVEIQTALLELRALEDSPVIQIGSLWKAKSTLDLLAAYSSRIPSEDLNRFLETVENLLSEPDPQLELPEEQRYAASIYGKVRSQSGYLIDAICDTLVKLSVRGPEIGGPVIKGVNGRVDGLIQSLLSGASENRWLSLASYLSKFAEASPETFISILESDLSSEHPNCTRLLKESKSSGFMGRCWHADLLWALESIAWAPQRLVRVSLILAKLSKQEIEGNWGNSPLRSLISLYRTWLPQTAATVAQRIQALKMISEQEPEISCRVLEALINTGHDSATPNHRPNWRDEDSGVGNGVSHDERHEMLVAAADLYFDMAMSRPGEIAVLTGKFLNFDPPRQQKIIDLLEGARDASDQDKAILCDSIRNLAGWQLDSADADDKELEDDLKPLLMMYEELAPSDPIARHAWLFSNHWPDIPQRTRHLDGDAKGEIIENHRSEGLVEIFDAGGWNGIMSLATQTKEGQLVGSRLLDSGVPEAELSSWIFSQKDTLQTGKTETSVAGGIIQSLERSSPKTLDALCHEAINQGKSTDWIVRLLILRTEGQPVWNFAAELGEAAEKQYWSECFGYIRWVDDLSDREFGLRKLIEAKRPITALQNCHLRQDRIDPEIIASALEGMATGQEMGDRKIAAHDVEFAVTYLEESNAIDQSRLARIEFPLVPVFSLDAHSIAHALYRQVTNDPQVFVDLLSLVYRSDNDTENDDENLTSVAWHVLNGCRRQPGTDKNGRVVADQFELFVSEARRLASKKGLLEGCDATLGEIFAHAPQGQDGIFPFEPVRDVFDKLRSERMLNGFVVGCHNKRGVTTRSPYDGGQQERELAKVYRSQSKALEISHPSTASVLAKLADSYLHDATREDERAQITKEKY